MKKKIVTIMLAAMMTTVGMAGCGKSASQEPEAGTTENTDEDTADSQEAAMPEEPIDEAFGQPSEDEAEVNAEGPARIYGVITDVSATEQTITVDNQSDVSSTGEIILTIDPENTYVIDAQTGMPVDLADVKNESFEAYLGDAMTMSLPPQCTPYVVIVNLPEDTAAPQYAVAAEDPADAADVENAVVLKATDGRVYLIDKDVEVTPYLTKNIVKIQDIVEGTACLLWEDENEVVNKVMIFAQ